MNTANKITLFRILLIPVMVALFYLIDGWGGAAAAIVFAVASMSDLLDGYIARKQNKITPFGKIFDPLADKMLVAAAMIILLDAGGFAYIWGAVGITIIFIREFLMAMIRQLAAIKGTIVAADFFGKLKTLCLTLSVLLLFAALPSGELYSKPLWYVAQIAFLVSVLLTVFSLIIYFINNRGLLKNASKVKEIRLLNAGHSAAYPGPDTVYAVQEQYPQKAQQPASTQATTQNTQTQQRPVSKESNPQNKVQYNSPNLVTNLTEGRLTRDIFDSIVLYVIATQTVSLNKIQDKFQIGYLVASDAIDKMEELNYITKLTPTSKRRVLITRDEYLNLIDRQD